MAIKDVSRSRKQFYPQIRHMNKRGTRLIEIRSVVIYGKFSFLIEQLSIFQFVVH